MRFPSRLHKVEKVVHPGNARPALAQPHLNAEAGRLEALDGFVLVAIPVEIEEGDVSGPIPLDAIKTMRRVDPDGSLRALPGVVETPSANYSRPDVGNFPTVDQLFPNGEIALSVGLNAKLLWDLAQALGSTGPLRLDFGAGDKGKADPRRAIRVSSIDRDSRASKDARGLIMPISLAQEEA